MRWEDNSKTRFAVDSQSSTSKTVETEAENVQDTDLTGSRKGAADTNDSKISPSLPDDQGQLLFQKIVQNRLNNKGFKDYYGVIRFTIALSLIWMFVEIARYITMDPPASIDISRHVYYYVWFAGMVRFFLGDWLYFMVAFSRWFICTKRAIEQWGYHCASEILRGSQLDEQTNGKKLAPEELEDLFHIKLGIIHENWHLPLSILNQKFSYPISISYFGLVLVVLNYLMGYWPDFNGIQIAVLSATIIFLIYLTKLLGTIAETYQLAVDIFRHPTILLALQKKVGVDSSQYLMDNYLLGSDVGFKLFGTSISHSSALSFVGSFLLGFTFAFGPTLADMIIASTTS